VRERLEGSCLVNLLIFGLMVLGPLALKTVLGWPDLPSWDNCTTGWAIPC